MRIIIFILMFLSVIEAKSIPQENISRMYNVIGEIYNASDYYNVPRYVIATSLNIESDFRNNIKSDTGVTGIAQITRTTAKFHDIDKSTIYGQIMGMAKMHRYIYNRLPKRYSDKSKWQLVALIYNRGKGGYFKAIRLLRQKNKLVCPWNIIDICKTDSYLKEGYNYVKKFNRYKNEFKELLL